MPFGAAQILVELIDNDDGDENWTVEQDTTMWEYFQERFLKFRFYDRERGKDRAEITFRNNDYKMLDNPVFSKGQKLLMSWGWIGNLTVPQRMVVQKLVGRDKVTVMCHCMLSQLDKEKRSRMWVGATDSEFVRGIAAEYGYTGRYAHVDETDIRHDIAQNYKTDARFINRLARKNGFEFWIDATGFHWHKRRTNVEPIKTYICRTDPGVGSILNVPKFEVNLTNDIAKVKVVARDPRTKREIVAYGGPNDTRIDSLGFEDEMGDPDDANQGRRANRMARVDVRAGGILTQAEAQREADARYFETAKNRYKMEMPVIGDPRVGAKQLVELWETADIMDGTYYLKEVVHDIERGQFTQVLKGRKDAVNKVPSAKKIGRKTNVNATLRLEDTTIWGEKSNELKKVLMVKVSPGGAFIPAWSYGQSGAQGALVGDVSPDELSTLSNATLERLFQQGAQSQAPDTSL